MFDFTFLLHRWKKQIQFGINIEQTDFMSTNFIKYYSYFQKLLYFVRNFAIIQKEKKEPQYERYDESFGKV